MLNDSTVSLKITFKLLQLFSSVLLHCIHQCDRPLVYSVT